MPRLHAKRVDSKIALLLDPLASLLDTLSHFRPQARLRRDLTITISNGAPQEAIDGGHMGNFFFHLLPDFRHFAFAPARREQADCPGIFGNGYGVRPSLLEQQ